MKSIGKIFIITIFFIIIIEFLTRTFLFLVTNLDAYKYGFKKTVVFEIVDLSKFQINIVDKSKELNSDKRIKLKAKSINKNIWIFGGSTTYGHSCEQGQSSSWPIEIKKLNQDFNYVNYAFNGANSDQSSIIFWKNIVKTTPDIIFWAHKFNTLNVIGKKNYRNKKILNYEFSQSNKNNLFLNIKRINKTLLEKLLFYSLLDKIILRINSNFSKPIQIKPNKVDINYALKNYEINTKEVIEIAKKSGVKEFYLLSLFHEGDWESQESLKYLLYNEIINNLETEYFPFVKIIDVKIDIKFKKKDFFLCDSVHQKYEGNKIQAKIIYNNLIKESKFFK